MTSAAAEEKRADERRIKELREFQRTNPANRRCFDCNEMMPQYVCLDFNTFVCTTCSGIHREFAHRVKGISMSKFTDTEVKNMLSFGGNEAAQKYWRARHDPSFRPSGSTEGERIRNFIRLTYIDRKWVFESPKASKTEGQLQRTSSGKKASFDTKETSRSALKGSTPSSATFDAFGSSSFDKPKTSQQDEFAAFGSASPASSNGFGNFGDFSNIPVPAAAPPLRDEFKSGSFKLAPPPGSHFSAAATATPTVTAPVSTTPAPSSTTDDLFGFSTPAPSSAAKDPFGFGDTIGATTKPANAPAASSPFDPFGSSTSISTSSTISPAFDAFGASAPASSRSASSSFDAQATPVMKAAPVSSTASPFDAFGASKPAETNLFSPSAGTGSGSLGAFGASDPFSAFSSSAPQAQAPVKSAPADPFADFSSNVSQAPEPAKSVPADPFAAFEDIPSTRLSQPSSAPIPDASDPFGMSATPSAAPSFRPATASSTSSASIPSNDPFAFAGVSQASPQPTASTNQSFIGFNQSGNVMSAVTPQPGAFGNAFGSSQMHMPSGIQGFNPQSQSIPSSQFAFPPHQVQGQAAPAGQSWQMPQTQSNSAVPGSKGSGSRSGAMPQAQKPAPNVAALNDPFASLSLGSFGLASPAPAPSSLSSSSRTNSRGFETKPLPAMNQPSSMGMAMSMGMSMPSSAPSMMSGPGSSRGSSFETPNAARTGSGPALSFPSVSAATSMPQSQSPMGSCGYPAMSTPQTASFSNSTATPTTTAPTDAFAAFGDFGSASTAAPPPPAPTQSPSINPFDLF